MEALAAEISEVQELVAKPPTYKFIVTSSGQEIWIPIDEHAPPGPDDHEHDAAADMQGDTQPAAM